MNYPLEIGDIDDYPVRVGSMLLTLVDGYWSMTARYD